VQTWKECESFFTTIGDSKDGLVSTRADNVEATEHRVGAAGADSGRKSAENFCNFVVLRKRMSDRWNSEQGSGCAECSGARKTSEERGRGGAYGSHGNAQRDVSLQRQSCGAHSHVVW